MLPLLWGTQEGPRYRDAHNQGWVGKSILTPVPAMCASLFIRLSEYSEPMGQDLGGLVVQPSLN